jgi:AraC-like DNA-binding protein
MDTVFTEYAAVQFMSGGSLYFQRGDTMRREWHQPVFFWTDMSSRYQYGPGSNGYWEHHWVTMKGEAVALHIMPLLENLAPEGVIPVSNTREVLRTMQDLIQSAQAPLLDSAEPIHQLHQLLAAVYEGKPGRPDPHPRIRAVQDLLDQAPGEDWDFQKMARQYGMSYSQFRRRFREHTGQAPGSYVTGLRLRQAAELLAGSSRSAQEIGEQVGYPDPAHFSKAFKKRYGVSPRTYRDNLKLFG